MRLAPTSGILGQADGYAKPNLANRKLPIGRSLTLPHICRVRIDLDAAADHFHGRDRAALNHADHIADLLRGVRSTSPFRRACWSVPTR
ncbi:MAG: hypothetical protein WA322_15780 [Pseudolabrys sp.]